MAKSENSELVQDIQNRIEVSVGDVADQFGTILAKELLKRLEDTVDEFYSEIVDLVGKLERREKNRKKILSRHSLEGTVKSTEDSELDAQAGDSENEIPEWEKKLAELDSIK